MLVTKTIKFWHVQIVFSETGYMSAFGFSKQPTREDLYEFMRRRWLQVEESKRENVWEVLLIAMQYPENGLIGMIQTIYGSISCYEREIIDNTHPLERYEPEN